MLDNLSKNQKRKVLGSFASTALLGVFAVLVAVIYFSSSLGWFASNANATGTGMQMHIKPNEAESDCTVYIFDAKANAVRYTGDGKEGEPQIDDLKMQIHDVIFKSRNRYTPAIVHLHLTNVREDLRSGGNVTVHLTRNSDPAYVEHDGRIMLPEVTTSILRFTLVNNAGVSWLGTDPDPDTAAGETYDNTDAALYAKIVTNKDYTDTAVLDLDSKVFANITKTAGTITEITKPGEITLTVGYTSAQAADGILDLFLYITYDESLVDDFEHSVGIDTGSTTVGKITTLLNDLTDLSISFDE